MHARALGSDGSGLLIVHDQAADIGGHERAVQALLDRYPAATAMAPRFTPTSSEPGGGPFGGRTRQVGAPGRRRPFLAPMYSRRMARAGVTEADAVLSVTQNGWSLAAPVPPSAVHLCYSGGLPPHLYGHSWSYLMHEPPHLRPVLAAALPLLRRHDRRLMRRPARLIANSRFSARELERVHGRPADVVHPPVRVGFFGRTARPRRFFLVVARLIAFKQVGAVVEAFQGLEDERLVVAGEGPLLPELRRKASRNVRFVGPCDDDQLLELYGSSRALICPSLETFGLAMAEAQAAGAGVIARRAGGALEVVTDARTGILLERPDPPSIAEAVRSVATAGFDERACRASAERFAEPRFTEGIERILEDELRSPPTPRR